MAESLSGIRGLPGVWSQKRLILVFVVALFVVTGLLGFVLGESYLAAERQAETNARNIAGVLEARLGSTIRRIHADLEHLAAVLPRQAMSPDAAASYKESVSRELALYAARFPEIVGYRVVANTGEVIYASEASFQPGNVSGNTADRDYFQALKNDPALSLVFSGVVNGRISGRNIVIIAVPVRGRSGEFLGLVMAPLDLRHFQQLFDAVDLGPNGVITFRRSDDARLVLRRPIRPDTINQKVQNNPLHLRVESGDPAGIIRFRAALDGVERIYAYQRIGAYPFYVAAGVATTDYLAAWYRTAALAGASALLLALLLLFALLRVMRLEREEAVNAQRLGDSEARYRMLADNSHDVIWTLDIPSLRFTYVSPSVERLRGFTPEEVMAQPLEASLVPESAAQVVGEIAQRVKRIIGGEAAARVVTGELDQVCKNGGVVATEVVSSYLLDADGVPRTILGIARDIGARKAAEQALRDTNQRLHAQIDEIERLQSALQEQAVRDGLTGLYNRRYLDETLEREVSRARREGHPLSLVMLDIDYFKRVNDTYGHQFGDEILKALGAALLLNVRAEDVACRFGGEEFLILLPNMPLEAARGRAESLRQLVEALAIAHGEFTVNFTISLGVSAYPEHGKTPDDLTRCADQALYRAKHSGRNCVVVFGSEVA